MPTIVPGLGQIPALPSVAPPIDDRSLPLAPGAILPRLDYAEGFQCVGPACEDSCCKAWDLRLDQATYERYQLIPAESLLGQVVQESVVVLPEPGRQQAYARILLNEALECPFLTEEKWCGIQQALGEEGLSPNCRTYPRIERKSPTGRFEITLHLSCPEAARRVLLAKATDGSEVTDEKTAAPEFATRYDAWLKQSLHAIAVADAAHFDVARFAEVTLGLTRNFLRLLLRDRRYSLGERMWLMGVFADRLKTLLPILDSGAAQKFSALLGEFGRLAGIGTLLPALAQVAGQPTMQLALTFGLVNQRLGRVMNSLRFLDDFKAFLDGIGYQPGMTPESLTPGWLRAESDIFAPWMEAHPWLLENYLEHALDRSGFPFGKSWNQPDPKEDFHALVTHFVVLRTLLIGVAATRGHGFSTEHAVRLVQNYSRMVDHHAEFLATSARMLDEAHWTDSGSFAGLLLECAGRTEHSHQKTRMMA